MPEALILFNNATHLLRDDFAQAADALIQWHRDQIERLTQAKADVRRATDPVCGLPHEYPEWSATDQRMAAKFAHDSRADAQEAA